METRLLGDGWWLAPEGRWDEGRYGGAGGDAAPRGPFPGRPLPAALGRARRDRR